MDNQSVKFPILVSEQWLEVDIGVAALVTNVQILCRAIFGRETRAKDIQVRVGNQLVGHTSKQVSRVLQPTGV